MIRTFTVYGYGSTISSGSIYPPVKLQSDRSYTLGLVGLYTSHTVHNIYEGNNKFYYGKDSSVTIPTGAYEIEEINNYLQKQIARNWKKGITSKQRNVKETTPNNLFLLTANNNTLKCEIESLHEINFKKPANIGRMLGFSTRILKANTLHESDLDVNIISTNNIFVQTNITAGAYLNNRLSHSIFEFNLDVEPGYSVVKEPSHVIYFPLSVSEIDNITIQLVDHIGDLVKLAEDTYTSVRLELKEE